MNRHSLRRYLFVLVGILVAMQLVVILGSWLWSAAMPQSHVRAILSDAGIRWFFGSFVSNLASPLLVWIVILDIAVGCCVYSGLWGGIAGLLRKGGGTDARVRSGLNAAIGIVAVEAVVVLMLVVPRHAILLSATGRLFPSSFSQSIVPIVAFIVLSASISYGLFSGVLHNFGDVVGSCIKGGGSLKFLLAIYVLAMELYRMVQYVFGV